MRKLTAASAGPEYVKRARELDSRLHDLIAASCGNALLAREIGRLKLLFRAYRDVSWERVEAQNDYRRIPVEAREHLAIIDTLVAGDAKAAAKAMAKHIRSGERYWSRVVPNTVHPTNRQPIAPHPEKSRRR
jgi:DNA-binding GntR family transcriptional regulator